MDKVKKFAENMDGFVLVARKVKWKYITMKESRVNKAEFKRQKRILKEILNNIEKEI